MSRYIDADVLMKKLDIKADCKECNSIDHFLCCLRSRDFVNACEAINDAPSIDIVFCKECKYFIDNLTEDATDEMYDACRWDWKRRIPNPDDFCSYGEVRDE